MEDKYLFREIRKDELSSMFSLILDRMKWMDDVGIKQWNETEYDKVYPLSYYEECRQLGEIFVLVDKTSGELCAVGALKATDARWVDPIGKAFYLHHFASRTDKAGLGSLFLKHAEGHAKSEGAEFFRLDSAVGNGKLERYYTTRGYRPVGECVDGAYYGILREKKL